MSFINYSSREINCKIVYYGPGLCGKTTNLQFIYANTNQSAKGKMISLTTETERTLFFDFLPLSLAEIGYDLDKIPYVIQYNKRDLPNAAPLEELRGLLNPRGVPDFEAIAPKGDGVYDTLKAIARLILTELKKGT